MGDIVIPEKLYFKIGEVAELTGVKPHVLRYWEAEFGAFRPAKSRSRQRLYQRKDIELVFRLKELLYQQGYTIAGARKLLGRKGDLPPTATATSSRDLLDEVRRDLHRLRDKLGSSSP
ncbi:MAG: MerR family transcriptional regulator [Desulfuromonas sp.]|nr:MAG: MerR family transcriptional regulator [Desulfuromonas sp.]